MDQFITFRAFCRMYATEEACARKLFAEKWPNGFRCPACGGSESTVIRTRRLPLFECRRCRRQTSLTVGTVMERSKTSLVKWFQAIYWLAHGANACELADTINVTYKTAWLIAHKIRHAIRLTLAARPLAGSVHLSEARFGATSFAALYHTRSVQQPLIAAATLSEDGRIERARMAQVAPIHVFARAIATEAFRDFIRQSVSPNAKISLAPGLFNSARHRPLFVWCREAARYLNRAHFGLPSKHLQAYLDQYGYRFPFESGADAPIMDLLCQCSRRPAISYPQLVRPAV